MVEFSFDCFDILDFCDLWCLPFDLLIDLEEDRGGMQLMNEFECLVTAPLFALSA